MAVSLVVHGHFYQPPRENPWTEEVAREPSAGEPFHDWNERITAECYGANAAARVVDDRGRIVALVDNYQRLSLDAGPTLLSWLERHAADAYAAMVAAPRAIAHAYSHSILPLATERDARTQIRWGIADFRHRFGRLPAGMWLPECAASEEVLAVLAEEGVRFTILAPGQIAAVRPLDGGEWEAVGGAPDTGRPYRWCHPTRPDLGLDLVVYDGGLSHEVAFALPMLSSAGLVQRAAAAGEGLVVVAADGETFGHHHRWGERAVAYALAVEAPAHGLATPSLEDAIAARPPVAQARVRVSSWSCAHGVGRWTDDCGCSTGGEPGWNQAWRAPLRRALDVVREHLDAAFETRGRQLLRDPWAARDAYIEVVLGATSRDEFAAAHVVGDPVDAFTLLEAARAGQAMYTSCGWFFNDLAGLETVQVLRYAARTMDLLEELGESPGEDAVLAALREARSNVAAEGNGEDVWRRHVVPARVTPERVAAHLSLTTVLAGRGPVPALAAWDLQRERAVLRRRGELALAAGVVRVTHRRTGRSTAHAYACLRLSGLDVLGSVRQAGDPHADGAVIDHLVRAFDAGAPVTHLLRAVGEHFGPGEFGLEAGLPGRADQLVAEVAEALADVFAAEHQHLLDRHRAMVDSLLAAGHPLPLELRRTAEVALGRRLELTVTAQGGSTDADDYDEALSLARSALARHVDLDVPAARGLLTDLLDEAIQQAVRPAGPGTAQAAAFGLRVLALSRTLGVPVEMERAQEKVYAALVAGDRPDLVGLGKALSLAVGHLGLPG